MSILQPVLTFLLVLVIFNLMIIVHELGHFLAARWRGLVIEEFGIWFGKPLWKKKFGGVWYSLGTIPFGGFVKLPQMAAMDTVEGATETPSDQLPHATPLSKIIVAFAGPLFSFLLAVFFAIIVYTVGKPVTESEMTTTIGAIQDKIVIKGQEIESPAKAATTADGQHLQPGDKILSIDGFPVTHWAGMGRDSVQWRIVSSEGETLDLRVQRGNEVLEFHPKPVIPDTSMWRRKALRQIGIEGAAAPVVTKIDKGSTAEQANLREGDVIVAANGKHIYTVADLFEAEQNSPITLTVQRNGKDVEVGPINAKNAIIFDVVKDSPAAKAGVKPEDQVVAINGQPFSSAAKFTDLIKANGAKPLTVDLLRDGKPLQLTMTPAPLKDENAAQQDDKPHIGVKWANNFDFSVDPRGVSRLDFPTPPQQLEKAAMSIVDTVSTIASRKSHVGIQQVGGAVMMMRTYYAMLQIKDGWRLVLWFSVILNVNLAILNMLPIPPLDGSHITLSVIEAIRRRPVNVKLVEIVQTVCTVAIIGFMLFICFYDVGDLEIFPGSSHPPKTVTATPAPSTPVPAAQH